MASAALAGSPFSNLELPPDVHTAIVETIATLECEWGEAIAAGDVDELAGIWADDYSLTAPDGRCYGRNECLAAIGKGALRIERFEADAPKVHVYRDVVAIARGRARVRGTFDSHAGDAVVRHVTMYSSRGGRWRQAATLVTRVFLLTGSADLDARRWLDR